MLKRLLQTILLLALALVALSATGVYTLQQLYSAAREQVFSHHQCTVHNDWLRLQQKEHCIFSLSDGQSAQLNQQLQFYPWGLKAKFSLIPIYKGLYFEGQQGSWSLPFGSKIITFSAQAQGSIRTRKLTLDPWMVNGWLHLSPPYQSTINANISRLKLVMQNDQLIFDDLELTIAGVLDQQQPFIERSQIKFNKGRWINEGELEIQQFNLHEANLKEGGVLSVLADIQWQGIKISTTQTATRIDPTTVKLYFEELSLRPEKILNGTTFSVSLSENLRRITTELIQQAHHNGVKLTLEKFDSGIVFQDRTPDAMGLSGDFSAVGEWRVQPQGVKIRPQEQFKLNLDLSESLIYGPQLELMLNFIEQGWVYRRNGRLISRVLYRNQRLLANGRLVSALPLWPSPYEEDH